MLKKRVDGENRLTSTWSAQNVDDHDFVRVKSRRLIRRRRGARRTLCRAQRGIALLLLLVQVQLLLCSINKTHG